MSELQPQEMTLVDLKDLIFVVLRRLGLIIVIAAVFACAGLAYASLKASDSSSQAPSIRDISVRQPGESDEDYNYRVYEVERAQTLMSSIEYVTRQIDDTYEYISNSVLMSLNPGYTPTSTLQAVIIWDEDVDHGTREAISNAYQSAITNGDYLSQLAADEDIDPAYIGELIAYNRPYYEVDGGTTISADNQDLTCMINVEVVGPSTEFTEAVMDAIEDQIESKTNEYSAAASHTVMILGRQSFTAPNRYVHNWQEDIYASINGLQNQINNSNGALDSISKNLGMTDRSNFYEPLVNPSGEKTGVSVKSCIKYGGTGFIFGLFLASAFIVLTYIWGRKVISQKQFFNLFRQVDKIGVCKPDYKRSTLAAFFDKKTGDDSSLTAEDTNKLIKANLNNQTAGMSKLLITGTADKETAAKALKDIGIEGDIKLDLFSDPDILKNASDYDGIVLVEQRGVSDKKTVREEIGLLNNSGKKIIGAIIL